MASKAPSSSAVDLRRTDDAERHPGKKSSITRVRTGCFTCRKRKKKCDERKPICVNCQKTGVVCEGFPPQVHWEARAANRRSRSHSAIPFTTGVHNEMAAQQSVDFGMPFMENVQAISDQMPATQDFGYIFDPHLGKVDYIFDPLNGTSLQSPQAAAFDYNDPRDVSMTRVKGPIVLDNLHDGGQELAAQQLYLPRQLPFLISGVDTEIHQRLFCHFSQHLSQVLTISVGDSNPMNGVVIPLAMRDRTAMDTILCLAGSHLLKIHEGEISPFLDEIRLESFRLHEAVVNMQSYRIQILESTTMDGNAIVQSYKPDMEVIFATSILLCLYELVEGSSDDGWRNHLSAARRLITTAFGKPSQESDQKPPLKPSENLITEIDPFLIEYFLYHDALAAVTVPSLQLTKLQSADLANHDPTMIGVQDGLSDFIARISALRTQATLSQYQPDGNVVAKAVSIWEDLAKWRPNDAISTERKMIAQFYQWALYIWLFSIVYPDGDEDIKVQNAVHRIAREMSTIKYGDSVMSCLLFPLFVIGSAAIRIEDREIISAQFERLNQWSRLGNVDLTFQVVKKMWDDRDMGMARSWDWVKQLETHDKSLLVT